MKKFLVTEDERKHIKSLYEQSTPITPEQIAEQIKQAVDNEDINLFQETVYNGWYIENYSLDLNKIKSNVDKFNCYSLEEHESFKTHLNDSSLLRCSSGDSITKRPSFKSCWVCAKAASSSHSRK